MNNSLVLYNITLGSYVTNKNLKYSDAVMEAGLLIAEYINFHNNYRIQTKAKLISFF